MALSPEEIKKRRAKIESRICKIMTSMDPSGDNTERYRKFFASLNDKQFAEYMENLRTRKDAVNIVMPNMVKRLDMHSLIKAAEQIGLKVSHRLWMTDKTSGRKYLTNQKYMVLTLPIRRAQQEWDKKLSVPNRDRKVDALTGQVIAEDRACALSSPEIQSLGVRGLTMTLRELIKTRGGDVQAWGDLNRQLMENGEATLSSLNPRTRVRSADIAHVLLEGMMIENNL